MGTAYIQTTIDEVEGGVSLYCETHAEVEYTVEGNELRDWHISDFRFDLTGRNSKGELVKTGEVWCADDLRPLLMRLVNKDAIEEKLIEHLFVEGELSYTGAALRADYHAQVL